MPDGQLSERWDRAFNPHRYGADGEPAPNAGQSDTRMRLASAASGNGGGDTHKATSTP
ncbi:hypothetical protein FHS39_001159 [Streptomyces olivoverticillatus]|uniref:Uncharacterized protein n=1 Tax=Streptomyces olivoverticillatus TaxID=66427 RepID=A0A7W7LKX8_9ACTN|nr:hypothetical protein [Streptomyces olivoverticillatus]